MLRVEIWNGKTPINGVNANVILENRKDIACNLNDIFLVINEHDIVTEIQFGKTIATNNKIDPGKSLQEIAEEYLIIKKSEEDNEIKEQINLEEQSKKIDILNSQNANLLLDNAKKEIEINYVNKKLANVTLEIAKMKGGM